MRIAILYGSTTGQTRRVAELLRRQFPGSDLWDVAVTHPVDLASYEVVLIGTSTWGTGALQDDWAVRIGDFPPSWAEGKLLAFFGLGDRIVFPDTFCAGVALLEARFVSRAGRIVAPNLLLDDDNDPGRTEALVTAWASRIKGAGVGDR